MELSRCGAGIAFVVPGDGLIELVCKLRDTRERSTLVIYTLLTECLGPYYST